MNNTKQAKTLSWGPLEWFVIIVYLSSALFFIPGASSIRAVLRALPYLSSLLLLFVGQPSVESPDPRYARLIRGFYLILTFICIGIMLPTANRVIGMAQLVFQLSIMGPIYWMRNYYPSEQRISRLIFLVLLCNGASATVGVLQAYYPERFMPPELSAIGGETQIESLSYERADGKKIVRPPGLTDLPGGAASGAGLSLLFGMAYAFRPKISIFGRALAVSMACIGLYCLYLTGVRSLTIMTIISGLFLGFLFFRQGRFLESFALLGGGGVLVTLTFAIAVAFGGSEVQNRFASITDEGVVTSFASQRGIFVEDTLFNLLFQYPFGAGSGKFGMMVNYFAPYEIDYKPALWVEIQMTGWLFDGGIPLVITYYGIILFMLFSLYSLASRFGDSTETFHASVAFSFGLLILGSTFAGPSFNNTLGLQFWFVCCLVLRESELSQLKEWKKSKAAEVAKKMNHGKSKNKAPVRI